MARTGAGTGPSQGATEPTPEDFNSSALKTLIKHGFVKKKTSIEVDVGFIAAVLTKIAAKMEKLQGAVILDEAIRATIIILHELEDTPPAVQAKIDLLEADKEYANRMEKMVERMEKWSDPDNTDRGRTEEKMEELAKGMQKMEESLTLLRNSH
jgi:hypothetical protein